jgi:putative chitinase
MLNKIRNKIPIQVADELSGVMKDFNITNSFRLTHFLAQVAHESGNFKFVRENLNYSAEGLLKVFPKYFDINTAPLYARKPEMIANIVYESRMGNGNRNTGDGWRFRGRGYLQLTGKTNYKAFGEFIGVDLLVNPDLVATKYPLTSAAWFFEKNKLWAICDQGVDLATIRKVTQRVNGGYNGISDRVSKTNVFLNLLV